jgi:hypothetical protein
MDPKAVAKWKQQTPVTDAPMRTKPQHSTALPKEQQALIVACRRQTLQPLDDCRYVLQATIPNLTRAALHRCVKRHGINRLPDIAGDNPAKKQFKPYPMDYWHLDIAEVRMAEGTRCRFVAVDRTCKCSDAELDEAANTMITAQSCAT